MKTNTNHPTVSSIIPCRNEVNFIEKCISSIYEFELIEGGFEVRVVDGMSDDGTRDKLFALSKQKKNLKVLDNIQKIVPKALNIGIKQAKGDYILRLDAHSNYPVDYLSACMAGMKDSAADNVGGIFITRQNGCTFTAKLVQLISTHRFGVGNANFRLNTKPC